MHILTKKKNINRYYKYIYIFHSKVDVCETTIKCYNSYHFGKIINYYTKTSKDGRKFLSKFIIEKFDGTKEKIDYAAKCYLFRTKKGLAEFLNTKGYTKYNNIKDQQCFFIG